jgi:hypothetical protein
VYTRLNSKQSGEIIGEFVNKYFYSILKTNFFFLRPAPAIGVSEVVVTTERELRIWQ